MTIKNGAAVRSPSVGQTVYERSLTRELTVLGTTGRRHHKVLVQGVNPKGRTFTMSLYASALRSLPSMK